MFQGKVVRIGPSVDLQVARVRDRRRGAQSGRTPEAGHVRAAADHHRPRRSRRHDPGGRRAEPLRHEPRVRRAATACSRDGSRPRRPARRSRRGGQGLDAGTPLVAADVEQLADGMKVTPGCRACRPRGRTARAEKAKGTPRFFAKHGDPETNDSCRLSHFRKWWLSLSSTMSIAEFCVKRPVFTTMLIDAARRDGNLLVPRPQRRPAAEGRPGDGRGQHDCCRARAPTS